MLHCTSACGHRKRMPRDAKPMPEPPTHTPMILMAALAVLAGAGVVYAMKTRASVKSVFHPKVWLSIFGIPFSILPILSWAPAVGLGEGDCAAQWDFSKDKDGKELHMCNRYEIVWSCLLIAHAAQALSFAWLHEGRTRARLAVGFGLVMMGVFFPGLYYATQGYDVKPPAPAYLVMATLFGGIALSGFLHLDAAKARSD